MPLITKITNKKNRKRNSSVKNKAKKQAKQNVTSSNEEINESEGRRSAPVAKKEGFQDKSTGLMNRKLPLSRDLNSAEFSEKVCGKLSESFDEDSSDEDILDGRSEKSTTNQNSKYISGEDILHDSLQNLAISTKYCRSTRSQHLTTNEEMNDSCKAKLLVKIEKIANSPNQAYTSRFITSGTITNLTSPAQKNNDNSTPGRRTRRNSRVSSEMPSSQNKTLTSTTPRRTRKSSILFDETPTWRNVYERISNEETHSTKMDLNSTPKRQTRRSSTILDRNNGPYALRGCASASKKTPHNLSDQLSAKSNRHLRERNNVNYRELSPSFHEKRLVSKTSSDLKRESSENELLLTPKKRERLKTDTPSRFALAALNEEVNENDPDCKSSADFTPESIQNFRARRSTRVRKSVADKNVDFGYEESPKKRKSTITTPSRKRLTPNTKRTSERKRPETPEGDIAIIPRKNITATPRRNSALTPRARRTLTPSMHQRTINVVKPKTSFQEIRARLHVSSVPKSLPCREEEFNNIFTFLRGKLTEGTGGCMYISGVPGTGKTATVNEAILCLKKLELKNEISCFKFVDINGMKLTEPRQAYVQILKKLTGVTASWEEAQRCLHQRFTTPNSRNPMTLLLVDEMDLLCNKRQDVVYNLLDWPTNKYSRLVVLTIANTMDLPERVLMGRVTSRLGLTRLTFQSYTFPQLIEIVTTRLKDSEAFRSDAIEIAARKVASVSGDARRALDICRRATEIAENNNRDCVTMLDVTSAFTEMIANPRVQAIKCCSIMERKFLESVSSEVQRTGVEQVTFKNVYKQFESLCLLDGNEVPNVGQVLEICRKLASWRLILWESGADLYQCILLNVSSDDAYFSKQKFLK